MVHIGDADGFVAGVSQHFPETIRPALQIIKRARECPSRLRRLCHCDQAAGLFLLRSRPSTLSLRLKIWRRLRCCAAEVAREFNFEPRVAMLSFSNFGSTRHTLTEKVRKATELVKQRYPKLMIDGEMMADTAVMPEILQEEYPFSSLKGGANVLIFPDLGSANAATN